MTEYILVCVAWPYAKSSTHVGQIVGAYLPADTFARYHRMAGNEVLMVSGSDEHGTPILVDAEREGISPREFVARYHRQICEVWERLGMSWDLYTETGTENHYRQTQDFFLKLYEKEILRLAIMILGACLGVQVPGHAQAFPDLADLAVIAGDKLARRDPLALGIHQDRCAVLIAARNHQHLIACHTMIARERVGRQIRSHNLAHMRRTLGVGPGYTNKYIFGHRQPLSLTSGLVTEQASNQRNLRPIYSRPAGAGRYFSPKVAGTYYNIGLREYKMFPRGEKGKKNVPVKGPGRRSQGWDTTGTFFALAGDVPREKAHADGRWRLVGTIKKGCEGVCSLSRSSRETAIPPTLVSLLPSVCSQLPGSRARPCQNPSISGACARGRCAPGASHDPRYRIPWPLANAGARGQLFFR